MSDTARWVHPKVVQDRKSISRDRSYSHFSRTRFRNGVTNTRAKLQEKVYDLKLVEALDEERAPRRRSNHKRPVVADNGRRWDRMVRHDLSVAWESYAGQSRHRQGRQASGGR